MLWLLQLWTITIDAAAITASIAEITTTIVLPWQPRLQPQFRTSHPWKQKKKRKRNRNYESISVCYLQELDDVAGSKDSMGNGELEWVSWREVRSQDTLLHAPAAEDLAGSTRANHHRRRRRRRCRRSSRGRGALRGWKKGWWRRLWRRWRWRWRGRVWEHGGGNMDWDWDWWWWRGCCGGFHFVFHVVCFVRETGENRGQCF